ncbi:hypothetical protein MMC08_004554 [Hypocenomyce scalaris]|nr:hypothetical protein [Hypocenomyce scalaris]
MPTPSTLRSRHVPPSNLKDDSSSYSATPEDSSDDDEASPLTPSPTTPTRISLLDILRLLGGLLLLSCTLSYFITGSSLIWNQTPPAFTRPARIRAWLRGPLHLSDPDLALYNGSDPSLPILLALNGTIYDVTAGRSIYGPGGMYEFFAGRDATRAFVTGCFDADLTPDLRGVEEMFVPLDDEPGAEMGRAGRKMRRKREVRMARRMVRDTVAGWEKLFVGGKKGAYFRVGRVKREEGWEERLGPVRELCEKAKRSRVRRGKGITA